MGIEVLAATGRGLCSGTWYIVPHDARKWRFLVRVGVPPGFDCGLVRSDFGGAIIASEEPAEGVDEGELADAGDTGYGEVQVSKIVLEILLGVAELLLGGPDGWTEFLWPLAIPV